MYGDPAFVLVSDGTDLQPGLSWDITPNLNFNPFLDLKTGGNVNLDSTSMVFTLSWKLI